MTALRFAPLIRVSTEDQERKGESLRTQTSQINQYVKSLGGTVPQHCWQYSGQEHATPNQERAKLDGLLEDSAKGLFDAVIVCDASRWSRDNLKSKEGLNTLRKHGIKFFVGTMEYDLFNPEHSFFLGVSAEIGELQARQQSLKSVMNRIERARRGIPSAGNMPYGRTFNKETQTWGLNGQQAKKITHAAKRYLAGDSIETIAKSLGMAVTNLWKVLNHRCGDKWPVRFKVPELNIDESVEVTIPRLLDERTIAAIKERARANKTYTHGEIKNKYLLSRMIFCGKCGHALFGQANNEHKRYYAHSSKDRSPAGCYMKKFIPAELIEGSVLIHLMRTFGDAQKIREAVEAATPDMSKVKGLTDERDALIEELPKITGQKEHVVEAVAEGMLSKEEVGARMGKLRDREARVKERLASIEEQLGSIPDPAKVKRLSKLGIRVFADATRRSRSIFKESYDWKRNLMEHAFAGRDAKGGRLGVYIVETGDPKQPWTFEIRGVLESTLLALPLSDEYLEDTFKLDPKFEDVDEELRGIRDNLKTSFAWC